MTRERRAELLQGTLDMLILRTLHSGRHTDTRSPSISSVLATMFSKLSMDHSIRPCIGWNRKAGTRTSGRWPTTAIASSNTTVSPLPGRRAGGRRVEMAASRVVDAIARVMRPAEEN